MSMMPPPPLTPTQLTSLLERVDNEIASAQDELQHAQPIAEAAGLSVHSSILDPSYQAKPSVGVSASASSSSTALFDNGSTSTTTTASTPTGPPALLDLQQEAALVVTARQSFNPLRGTLPTRPLHHGRILQQRSHCPPNRPQWLHRQTLRIQTGHETATSASHRGAAWDRSVGFAPSYTGWTTTTDQAGCGLAIGAARTAQFGVCHVRLPNDDQVTE